MNYLFYEKKDDTKAKVILTYNVIPPEYMLNDGNYVTVENILTKPQLKENEYAIHYINPQTKEQSYEICTREKTKGEIKSNEFEQLKENNKLLTETVAKLTIDSKKKDMMATQLATTVAKMNIEINKMKEGNK